MSYGVPETLEEAIEYALVNFHGVEKILDESSENEFSIKAHTSYGLWIRNNWGLWKGGTNLYFWFLTLGIKHPDDMSDIIMRSIHRRFYGKELELEKQVQHYKDYWKMWKDSDKGDDDDDEPDAGKIP